MLIQEEKRREVKGTGYFRVESASQSVDAYKRYQTGIKASGSNLTGLKERLRKMKEKFNNLEEELHCSAIIARNLVIPLKNVTDCMVSLQILSWLKEKG